MVYTFGSDSIPSVKNTCMIACKHILHTISTYCIKCLTWFLTSKISLTKVYKYCLATLWSGFVFGLEVCCTLQSTLTGDTVYSEASSVVSI